MPQLPSDIRDAYDGFQNNLDFKLNAAERYMAGRWIDVVENELQGPFERLAEDVRNKVQTGGKPTRKEVAQLQRYQSLLAQMGNQLDEFGINIEPQIRSARADMAWAGVKHAESIINLTAQNAGLSLDFNLLNKDAVEAVAAAAYENAPLGQLLKNAYPMAANGITDELIRGVALGKNPREVSRLMRKKGLVHGLNHIMLVNRDQMLRAQREGTLRQFRKTDFVKGFQRKASLSVRTCPACLALDGEQWPIDKDLAIHPQDRCSLIPIIEGAPKWDYETGSEWIKKQPRKDVIEIMGKGKFEAWTRGEFDFKQLATVKHHPVWGQSLQVTPLKDLLDGKGGFNPGFEPDGGDDLPDFDFSGTPGEKALNRMKNYTDSDEFTSLLEEETEAWHTYNQHKRTFENNKRQIGITRNNLDVINNGTDEEFRDFVSEYNWIDDSVTRREARVQFEAVLEYYQDEKQKAYQRMYYWDGKVEEINSQIKNFPRERIIFQAEEAAIEPQVIPFRKKRYSRPVERAEDVLDLTEEELNEIESGISAFKRIVGNSHAELEEAGETLKIVPLALDQKQRANFQNFYNKVNWRTNAGDDVMVHELGHFFEDNVEGAREAAASFWKHRVLQSEGEDAVLTAIHGRNNETGHPDKLFWEYAGRIYPGDKADNHGDGYFFKLDTPVKDIPVDDIEATEIISQGFQEMYRRPHSFADEDPEYFQFIYNLARGILP